MPSNHLITSKYQSILHAFKRGWKTVRAMDILFLIGEIVGDHKEKSVDVLVEMKALN
jgi:hypothetical protein